MLLFLRRAFPLLLLPFLFATPVSASVNEGYVLSHLWGYKAAASTAGASQTWYFGVSNGNGSITVGGAETLVAGYVVPTAGTVDIVDLSANWPTPGTCNNIGIYLRVNETTDYTITTTANSSTIDAYYQSSPSFAVSRGDRLRLKMVTPNPCSGSLGGFASSIHIVTASLDSLPATGDGYLRKQSGVLDWASYDGFPIQVTVGGSAATSDTTTMADFLGTDIGWATLCVFTALIVAAFTVRRR